MNERIKELRKQLGLTQQRFADKLGISRDTVANIEGDRIDIKDLIIKSICREFSVNEDWLRTGDGEMFLERRKDDMIADMLSGVLKEDENSFKYRLASALSRLDENGWNELEKLIDMIAEKRD